jgi:hypothetical protein
LKADPTTAIDRLTEVNDIRRARRALSADEVRRLLAAVPERYRLAYQILMATGLRRTELLKLRWGDLRLNAPHPFIQLRASTTKSKRADILPLRADLVDLLEQAKGDADDSEPVVNGLPRIPIHKQYLEAAGIPYLDDLGRRADIHALRHTFGTMLASAGVNIREAMELMRHTDMRLTTKVYTDPRAFNLAGAVEKLPRLYDKPDQRQAATGTEDFSAVADGRNGNDRDDLSRDFEGGKKGGKNVSENVSSTVALLGYCKASIDNTDRNDGGSVSPYSDSNWQQKTPPDIGGAKERVKGVEPSTFTLAIGRKTRQKSSKMPDISSILARSTPFARFCIVL